MFVVNQEDHENCKVQLWLLLSFANQLTRKSKKWSWWWHDDALHKLCSRSSQSADC